MSNDPQSTTQNFRGHSCQEVWKAQVNPLLSEIGPGKPCGEFFRRFWLPIALTEQVKELPLRIRILGEDLVLFREKLGQLGLVHLHCCHRNMSLEFGIIEEGGIRCSYHGWKYALDGTILETPCEPPASQVKFKTCLGAYPVVDYKGIIFSYMGPSHLCPPFPFMDTFDEEGDVMIPYLIESPCNWLQVMENAWDPYHVVYLHTKAVRTQFIEAFAEMPKIQFHERVYGDFYTNTRRVGDIIWIRTHDLFLPSFTQNGGHFPIPDQSRYFGRCGLSRWVTPIDDTRTMVIAWRHFREGDDPKGLTDPNEVGLGKTDFYGQSGDRDYETRQKDPGDYDAWVSQGPVNIHQRENLAFTDRGVAKVRRKLRSVLKDLSEGKNVQRPSDVYENPIPTYGGDTMLNIALQEGRDDAAIQKIVALKVAQIYQSGDKLIGKQRNEFIVKELMEYEKSWD